jgi:Ala-tRNA(Pro) deacylase
MTTMGVAMTLQEYLESRELHFDVIEHSHADSAMRAAQSAHIPGDQMAKPVLLGDDSSYLLAVVPATHRLDLDRLNQLMARSLVIMNEDEMEIAFSDCDRGAIPPVGEPYGIDTVVDTALAKLDDIYFEFGDHEHLIHMRGEDFRRLIEDLPRAPVSHHL